jgi:excisionase family DNA binding protein
MLMLTPPSSPFEAFRRAELRLRMLLFGDESTSPGFVRGEEPRVAVRAELRHMRDAVAELVLALEEASAAPDLADELRRAVLTPSGAEDELLTPSEAARALDVSASSVYRAARSGELRAVRLPGRRRGGLRIPADEIRRLAAESDGRDPAIRGRWAPAELYGEDD